MDFSDSEHGSTVDPITSHRHCYHVLPHVPAPILIGKMIDVFIARVESGREIVVYRGVLQGLMSLSVLLVGLGLDGEK